MEKGVCVWSLDFLALCRSYWMRLNTLTMQEVVTVLSLRQGNIYKCVSVKICKCEEVMFAIWFQAPENKEIQTQWPRDKRTIYMSCCLICRQNSEQPEVIYIYSFALESLACVQTLVWFCNLNIRLPLILFPWSICCTCNV